jgi:glucose/arabinose dehydrogenase
MRRSIIFLGGVAALTSLIAARGGGRAAALPPAAAAAAADGRAPACAPDNGGITLPPGLCAIVFADTLIQARHLVVAPNGDVIVSVQGGRNAGIVIFRDTNSDGVADSRTQFARGFTSSEVSLFDNHLYTENGTDILRYTYKRGQLVADGPPDTIVAGLPPGGNHPRKTFAIGRDGSIYVNVGSEDNICTTHAKDAIATPGPDPCTERDRRAGIWRFDARKLHQTQSTGEHYAIGVRNAVAVAINPSDGAVWVMQHGRDDLGKWPAYFTTEQNAEIPAEELFRLEKGGNYGWPYCYFDPFQKKKLLGPEYGGNGKDQGRCATMKTNVAAFPGHWAPNGLLFYTGSMLPAKYKNGAFIAFHGSWNRAPLPQAGFRVVFQPLKDNKASGEYETFAGGFAPRATVARGAAPAGAVDRRPVGLAQGPDGALYLTDDARGRIWKIVTTGGK